jgi:hypothetical protein
VSLVAVFVLLLSTAGLALAQSNESPASGHAQVIAHGVITMPAKELTWRRYEGSAPPRAEAQPSDNVWPGFIIGGEEPVLLDIFDDLSVVSEGKAALVRKDARLSIASLGQEEAAYDVLALTRASLEDDAAALVSDAFDAPDGLRQVDLVRDVLADGEETELPESATPTFVYVQDGELDLTTEDDESETLEAGEGLLVEGSVSLEAREDDTTLLAAVIGDEVAPRPRQTPVGTVETQPRTPTPAAETSGVIEFYILSCPPGTTVETIDEQECIPTPPDDGVQLQAYEGQELVESRAGTEAEPGQTGYVWTGLELRTWVLQAFGAPEYDVYVPESDQVVMIPGPQYEITLTEEAPYALVPIYRLFAAEQASTVTVTFLGCEEGQDPEFFLPENCTEFIPGSAAIVAGESDVEAYLGPEEAVQNEDFSLRWVYAEFDTFTVTDVVLPEGYVDYAFSENPVATSPEAPDAYVYVYAFLPLE